MPIRIRVALVAAAVAVLSNPVFAQSLEYVGSYNWDGPTGEYGGFSGIEVSENGMWFTVIGDKGVIVSGMFERNGQRITGVDSALQNLKNDSDNTVSAPESDSEGLAIGADGRVYVSFENRHRVAAYAQAGASAKTLEKHPDFGRLGGNDGLEALAIDADGTLYSLPEQATNSALPIYRYRNGTWSTPFQIPEVAPYKPVGADFGPDGKLYLLERRFRGALGFKNQIRRFEINGDQIGQGELLLRTDTGAHANLEGIALWRDAHGFIRVTMVADDNFNFFQRSEFVEYRLQE